MGGLAAAGGKPREEAARAAESASNLSEAAALRRKLVRLEPQSADAWTALGAALEKVGEHGGLLVYTQDASPDWGFAKFNSDPAMIMRYLQSVGSTPICVPYRENRAVIFDSDLFHATDQPHFRDGYANRRINITLLYELRSD